MTCAAEHNAQGTIAPLQVSDARSHESAAQLPGEQDLVGTGQDGRRVRGAVRDHADRVPGGGGDRRCFLTLATDIADRQAPAGGRPVGVIEVSADLDALGRGDVGGCQLDSGDLRQPAREQAGLQRVGDLRSPAEHVVNADSEGKLLAEFLDQA